MYSILHGFPFLHDGPKHGHRFWYDKLLAAVRATEPAPRDVKGAVACFKILLYARTMERVLVTSADTWSLAELLEADATQVSLERAKVFLYLLND